MRRKHFLLLAVVLCLFLSAAKAVDKIADDVVEVQMLFWHSSVLPDSNSVLKVEFNLADDWHFYADDSAPHRMNLKIAPSGDGIVFDKVIFPQAVDYFDKVTGKKLGVYSKNFSIYIPFKVVHSETEIKAAVKISGLACSQQLCKPVDLELAKNLKISKSADMSKTSFAFLPQQSEKNSSIRTSAKIALPLAILAGLLLNVMPCVWPVLPIIVMRLISQAKDSRAKSVLLGLSFAVGIIGFFVVLAVVNIIFKLGFGIVFQWGDQFRNQSFVIAMALLMTVLAMYMFGLLSFGIPASVSGKSGNDSGFFGSVGTGFLAAVLSTPCSFAILTFVLAWAQTQPIILATITILLIGVGMSLPYVVLTAVPKLLTKIPKPGKWMDLFKQATGFILLAIGVKLLEAVSAEKIINVLYYAVVLAICCWMWGGWVQYNTARIKKWIIRIVALVLAIVFGFVLLAESQQGIINWQDYDAEVIAAAKQQNQPVLIKFTADWCLSCKVLDKTVYSNSKIAELIESKNLLAVKADTTGFDYPASVALKEIYNQPAVPVTVLLLPDIDEPIVLAGNLIKKKLIRHLENLSDTEQ